MKEVEGRGKWKNVKNEGRKEELEKTDKQIEERDKQCQEGIS
jgi:hypothetical protein